VADTKLSITISTIDKATAGIKAINARLDAVTKPTRDFGKALSELREKSGLDSVIGGFKGVSSAIGDLLGKVAMIGGVVGVAVAGMFHLVDQFDELGDKAEAMGVSVEFLASMRYAAEKSGVSVEKLDDGMKSFLTNLGLARHGKGKLAKFLKDEVQGPLLDQLVASKSNAEAIGVLSAAAAKISNPAERLAFAKKTMGDGDFAPMLAKGAAGIKELTDAFAKANPEIGEAAKVAGAVDDAQKDLNASITGVKAALVTGLGPALEGIIKQLTEWFTKHRADIATWAKELGKRLPAAVEYLKEKFIAIVNFIRPFVDSTTKLKVIALVLAGVIAGPLISAIVSLGIALMATPVGWILLGLAAIGLGAAALIGDWGGVRTFFVDLWDAVKEKFGWVADAIALVMAPFLYIPLKIIANWDSITGFFTGLWDGVTSVFKKAWGIIGSIVDKIMWAVDKVKGAKDFLFGGDGMDLASMTEAARASIGAQAQGVTASSSNQSLNKFIVDFVNAPRGTRVKADPQNPSDADINVGYQLLGSGW
jgi:hypothetical protein